MLVYFNVDSIFNITQDTFTIKTLSQVETERHFKTSYE